MPSFLSYWQTLADDLTEWMSITATSTSGDTSTIVSTSLIDSSVGSDRYAYHYAYALDGALAGQQRVITKSGFAPTTGFLTVSRAFGTTPQSGVGWAIIQRFPILRHDKQPGLRDFINRALREIAVDDFITISATTNQVTYNLPTTTNWWILDPSRVLDVWTVPADTTVKARPDDNIERIYLDGETPVLQLRRAYTTGESFQLQVKRPANSRLRQSGTWTDQSSPTAGLSVDADEALAPILDVVTVAKAHAYESICQEPGLADARGFWEAKLKEQQASAALLKFTRQAPVQPYRLSLSGHIDMDAFR